MIFVDITPNIGEAGFSAVGIMMQAVLEDKNTERIFVLDINDAVSCLSIGNKELERHFKYSQYDIKANTKVELINALTEGEYDEKVIVIKFPFYIKYNVKETLATVQKMLSADRFPNSKKKQFCFMVNRSI